MMKSSNIRIDISATMFRETDWRERLAGIMTACGESGIELGVQLHNTSPAEEIAIAVGTGLPMTAHIPLLCDWQINLSTTRLDPALESLDKSVSLMRRYGIDLAVLHGFVMTDLPIPTFGRGRSYDEAMGEILRPELAMPGSRLCCDFFDTAEFAERRELTRENLAKVASVYPDVKLLIENDFPCYGAGNLLAECAALLDNDMCLDSSHLWASSFIYDRDFIGETRKFLDTGRVRMVHLHVSSFTPATPKTNWGDGHLPLTTPNMMRLPAFVGCCREAGVRHYVLEIRKASAEDIYCFMEMWNRGEEK